MAYEIVSDTQEMISSLLVVFRTQPIVQQTLYSIKLTNIKAGNLVHFFWDSEITNPFQWNAMICGQLNLANSRSPTDVITVLKRANGDNITAAQHHSTQVRGAVPYIFTKDYDLVYANIVVYASSSGSNGGQSLVVEQGYGFLKASIFR